MPWSGDSGGHNTAQDGAGKHYMCVAYYFLPAQLLAFLEALLPGHLVGFLLILAAVPPYPLAQVGINDFKDKKDLINACMASAHVPFFLDFKLSRSCRGRQCVDGSFPDFFTGTAGVP
jgi:hypothetical protein